MALRRQRWTGQQAAHETGVSPATVSRILRRARLSRIRDLEPAEPVIRYERKKPGDMIHLDIKKLGRLSGSATASPATEPLRATAAASVGSSSTSALTTTRASASVRYSPTKRRSAPWPS